MQIQFCLNDCVDMYPFACDKRSFSYSDTKSERNYKRNDNFVRKKNCNDALHNTVKYFLLQHLAYTRKARRRTTRLIRMHV